MTVKLAFASVVLGSVAMLGCGKSKIDQCNAFVDRANQTQTVVSGLDFSVDDAKKLEEQAAKLESEAKAIDAIQLEDEKLVGFRKQYAEVLNKLAKSLKDLQAIQKNAADPSKAAEVDAQGKKLEAEADTLEKEESALVDSVNKYCTGGE